MMEIQEENVLVPQDKEFHAKQRLLQVERNCGMMNKELVQLGGL
jgi:pyridoxal biosynthesis lyase PdxS